MVIYSFIHLFTDVPEVLGDKLRQTCCQSYNLLVTDRGQLWSIIYSSIHSFTDVPKVWREQVRQPTTETTISSSQIEVSGGHLFIHSFTHPFIFTDFPEISGDQVRQTYCRNYNLLVTDRGQLWSFIHYLTSPCCLVRTNIKVNLTYWRNYYPPFKHRGQWLSFIHSFIHPFTMTFLGSVQSYMHRALAVHSHFLFINSFISSLFDLSIHL